MPRDVRKTNPQEKSNPLCASTTCSQARNSESSIRSSKSVICDEHEEGMLVAARAPASLVLGKQAATASRCAETIEYRRSPTNTARQFAPTALMAISVAVGPCSIIKLTKPLRACRVSLPHDAHQICAHSSDMLNCQLPRLPSNQGRSRKP